MPGLAVCRRAVRLFRGRVVILMARGPSLRVSGRFDEPDSDDVVLYLRGLDVAETKPWLRVHITRFILQGGTAP